MIESQSPRWTRVALSLIVVSTIAQPRTAAAGWFTRKEKITPPSCQSALSAPPILDDAAITELGDLLRWVGMTHPVLESAWASPGDWRQSLTILHLATAHAITPVKGRPDVRSAPDWFKQQWLNVLNEPQVADDANALREDSPAMDVRRRTTERLLKKLEKLIPMFQEDFGERRERQAVIARHMGDHGELDVRVNVDAHRILWPDALGALVGLDNPDVVHHASVFLSREMKLIVQSYDAHVARAVNLTEARTPDLDAKITRLNAIVEICIKAYLADLQKSVVIIHHVLTDF